MYNIVYVLNVFEKPPLNGLYVGVTKGYQGLILLFPETIEF